jgi:hypothetical protein
MSERDEALPKLVQLTNDMLNGRSDSDGIKRLEEMLRGNPAAQKFFRTYCQLHVDLRAETQAQRVIQAFASDDWTNGSVVKAVAPQADTDSKLSARGGRRTVSSKAYGYVLASAASLALLALGLNALRTKRVALEVAPNAAAVATMADVVSVSITSTESRWLPIKDVGKIYVQGPAELELIGTTRAKLKKGKVRVHITDPRGRGFIVETPREEVTDLGTEFGVAVAGDSDTNVVVFEGAVNLAYLSEMPQGASRKERLVQGEGLSINPSGAAQRIMSIVRKDLATFRTQSEHAVDSGQLITDVADNIRSTDMKSFYEIVPKGLKEDAVAYVDRPAHDWNGVGTRGLPAYLIGADYIKPFNTDKTRKGMEITVTLAKPARLFVFFDDRAEMQEWLPEWLTKGFRNTGDKVGMDSGPYLLSNGTYERFVRGKGPGNSIDSVFSVWEKVITEPGEVRLGANASASNWSAMYGIAAVPLEAGTVPESEKTTKKSG